MLQYTHYTLHLHGYTQLRYIRIAVGKTAGKVYDLPPFRSVPPWSRLEVPVRRSGFQETTGTAIRRVPVQLYNCLSPHIRSVYMQFCVKT